MNTVKPGLVATSIKQATCIKQAPIQFPEQANAFKCVPVLSKHLSSASRFLLSLRCLFNTGWTVHV